MEDNKYWLKIWKMVAISICAIVVSVGGCQSYQNKQIAFMASSGVDPLKAACAISPQMTDRVLCASVVAK